MKAALFAVPPSDLFGAVFIVRNFIHYASDDRIVIVRCNSELFPLLIFLREFGIHTTAKITEHHYIALPHDSTLGRTTSSVTADTYADAFDTGVICSPISKRQIALEIVIRNKCITQIHKLNKRLPVN
jgi:hypothetical protein